MTFWRRLGGIMSNDAILVIALLKRELMPRVVSCGVVSFHLCRVVLCNTRRSTLAYIFSHALLIFACDWLTAFSFGQMWKPASSINTWKAYEEHWLEHDLRQGSCSWWNAEM